MTVRITGQTQIKSQTLVNFPPTPALNLDFTQGYANGLNPLPSTVTFARADASAIATQTGPDGLLRLAAHNLLKYSQDYSNSYWNKVFVTLTSGQTAPDGTSTAFLITDNSTNDYHGFNNLFNTVTSTVGATYVFSIYAKAGTINWLFIGLNDGADYSAWFNLSTGARGNQDAGLGPSSIAYVGNGWYRISITRTAATSTLIVYADMAIANGTQKYVGGSGTLYMWGAQLERNATPSYYVPTTSAAVYANTPRFDYDPVTLLPKGLLIEEARTNLSPYSQSTTNWTGRGSIALSTSGVSPDGSSPWILLTNGGTSSAVACPAATVSTSTSYAVSLYMKAGTAPYVIVQLADNVTNAIGAAFSTADGSFQRTFDGGGGSTTSWGVQSIGGGVYRVWFVGSSSAWTGNPKSVNFYATNTSSSGATTNGQTLFVWGVQLEVGSFPTSYIPTTSASVTRAAETATMTGTNFSSWYSATSGTFLTGFDTPASGTRPVINADNNSANNQIQVYSSGTTPTFNVSDGGSAQATITLGTVASTGTYRIAAEYKANDFSAAMGGTLGTPDTSGTVPTVDRLRVGGDQAGNALNGHVSRVQYWPARFSDAQLQLITKGA